ncbi:piggyBac transposable element-derived protein 4-like [Scomber scombrus]|uniref:PiggyBac transposable element-derived protein 4-like n=1 Tax=Scomber scombrus TaxID=13677 RepID=A0AAV1NSJ9_SCOSC
MCDQEHASELSKILKADVDDVDDLSASDESDPEEQPCSASFDPELDIDDDDVEMSRDLSGEPWLGIDVEDITPPQPVFRPARTPGPQLLGGVDYSNLDLFHLFISKTMLQGIWRDTRDISICSTIHPAHSDNTVQRRVKADGQWVEQEIPAPPGPPDRHPLVLPLVYLTSFDTSPWMAVQGDGGVCTAA